jgi:hypothetical protein
MQPPFSCVPATLAGIEGALSEARLGRYLRDAGGDKHYALRLYVWNIRLCETLYLPTQVCEVTLRNAIDRAVRAKHGDNWISRGSFLCTLPDRLKTELHDVIRTETATYGHGMTIDHVVSGLSFGFWLHLLTKHYDGTLWPHAFPICFPHKPSAIDRHSLYERANRFRLHRNRLAHHKPVYDRAPNAEYQNILDLVSWVCGETHWLVKHLTPMGRRINERPRG